MWRLKCVCVFIAIVIAFADPGNDELFIKCCPKGESLIKVSMFESDYNVRYECIDSDSAREGVFKIINFSQLSIAENVSVNYGIPEDCDYLQLAPVTKEKVTIIAANVCYDRLISEIVNGSQKNIHKTVSLICIKTESKNNVTIKLNIDHFQKCCPQGQRYDMESHVCKDVDDKDSVEWILKRLNSKQNYIYEVDKGLSCKSDQFAVELSERMFFLELQGGMLKVLSDQGGGKVIQGEWCVDREFAGPTLVARVCTSDCSQYGAYCLRKCCPIGFHFKPMRCGSLKSVCVPDNVNRTLSFNISDYLEQLKKDYDDHEEVYGIREGIKCSAGKFVLNKSSEVDRHYLTRNGLLAGNGFDPQQYCLEAFDMYNCDSEHDVIVTAVACFVKGVPEKNFLMSVVMNSVSAVCLFVTLVVYCSLPELKNLHGRTVICHISTMMLAYSSLARVQYSKINDPVACILLGYGIYFGFVGAFFWLNVMCFDIWWTFGSIRTVQPLRKSGVERKRFIWYSLYAWGVTLLLTLVMYLLDVYSVSDIFDANIGRSTCWFGSAQNTANDWPHYFFFVIPMGLVTSINLILWILTARHCARVKSEVHRLQAGSVGDRAKKRFRLDKAKYLLTGKLWVVMGVGWFSELLSTIIEQPPWLWAAIDLINELQGLFIFLLLVVKPKVYHLIKTRLGCSRSSIATRLEKLDAQKNTSSGHTSSTFLQRTISSDDRANLRLSLPTDVKRA